MLKKMLQGCLAAFVAIAITGCGAKFDQQAYVQSTLDAAYKGDVQEYVKLTASKEEDAKKMYEDSIKETSNEFFSILENAGAQVEDDQRGKLEGIAESLLKAASYETTTAEKVDKEKYTVPVKVKPLTSLANFDSKFAEYMAEFTSKVESGELDLGADINSPDVSEEDIQTATTKALDIMAEGIIDILQDIVDNPEYGEEQTINVNVNYDKSQNLWVIPESDILLINNAVMGL